MDQKVLYSVMGLAALPMVQTLAQTQNWNGTVLTVTQGQTVLDDATAEALSFNIGKLAPGNYNLAFNLTSKVYDVTVAVANAKAEAKQVCNNPGTTAQGVNIPFVVEDDSKDIVITLTSSDPGVSGAGYSFTAPEVSLSFDFATAKTTLTNNAQTLATTISGYNYAAKDEDVKAANALKTKASNVATSYDDYKKFKLYADPNTIQEEIDALEDKAAKAEAAYQNEQAYNRVNAAITSIKAKYNAAVAELEETLVGAAAYLLDAAKADLNENINQEITTATSASYASYQAGTAVADEATNTAKVPTEDALNAIVDNWEGQATTNINAYNALHAKVTALQAALDAVKPVAAIASLFPKTEVQAAIDAVNTKVENAKNSAAQLTLSVATEETAAQNKINEYKGKVDPANAEYNANEATKAAIATLQTNLNNAKTAVNAKVSKDGNYKAQDYYAAYVEGVQEEINTFTTKAAEAYKPDGTGTARSYNAALNTTSTQTKIDDYKAKAVDAVNKYDALQAAMTSYQKDLDEVRGLVEGLDIYTDEAYDYKTKLDLIQKRINDIKKAIAAAQEKKGEEHWTAMLAIDADAAITADVKALKDSYQADQNTYDKDYLDGSLTALSTSIATFNAGATLDKLGADYQAFADAEAAINTKVNNAQTERAAIDPDAEDAAEKIVALSAKVDNIKAEQTALEAAAAAVAAKVAANNTAKTTLATNIDNLQTKIGTFKTTYKIGGDDSTLGNRGKADGSVTKEVGEIETALGTLEVKNNAVTTTAWTNVEKTVAASGLDKGVYDVGVEVVAKAAGTATVNGSEAAYATGTNTYTLNNVFVSDGTLTAVVSGKEDKVTVKKLTYHENSLDATYNNSDEKNLGLNNTYTALNVQENALETAAPGIKKAVEDNAATYTSATKDVDDLKTAELNTLKSLTNVTNENAESDDAKAKKDDPANWKVFESDLAADKTYTAKKAAIDADITAMKAALDASKAEETLVAKWQNKTISVTEKVDGKDVTTTYSISAITAAINALKNEAVAESDNWEAYKALQDNNMSKLLPDTITVSAADLGEGAVAYYQGLKNQYIADKATILANMQKSLKARTAVSTKSGFETEIAAVIAKVKVVQTDGVANKKKYDDQVKAYTETQTLWNSTYTEIAATDHSSKVQEWLDQLDAIQVDLTAATEAVEANYKVGKSVAEAKDFAAIKARINDVKAQQSESYNAQIAADNQAAHESFMGTETTKGAIQLATEAYQKAVQERATYSTTNKDIEEVVTTAAATLDEILYNCPTKIEALTAEENEAYEAVTSPTVFDVDPFNIAATAIEKKITDALNDFKADVKTALGNFWTPKQNSYDAKVGTAENDIADYKAEAKKDAFKDVKDLIAKGTNGVNSLTLSEVEAAIAGLTDIDDMLAADKDAAAVKDIDLRTEEADAKYTEVKAYIEGVNIVDDVNNVKSSNLNILNNTYRNYVTNGAKRLAKNFDNREDIKWYLDQFVSTADACENNVKTAVANDVNNTKAYEEMAAAITPVAEKLAEAKAAAAPYKYATSFATNEQDLETLSEEVEDAKEGGYAVAYKTNDFDVETISAAIEQTLTNAFGTEKAGLATDITELKNQYNAYVAANGLNETANGFKAAIDELETQLGATLIKDLDNPADGIQFDEIVAATEALIALQNSIADLETELLAANNNQANAAVLADFTSQLDELAAESSLEGNDAWVGEQSVNGKTIAKWVEELSAQIAELKSAIEAEPNLSFYKNQYQEEIDAIEADLTPVVEAIAAKQAQFTANAAAYADLCDELQELQDLVNAATAKVGTYVYAYNTYKYMIESYNWRGVLTGGVQYDINQAKNNINAANNNVSLDANSDLYDYIDVYDAEVTIQSYLDESAYSELTSQKNNLDVLLANTIDIVNHEGMQKYSSVLWARLIAEKNRINNMIVNLGNSITSSHTNHYYYNDNNVRVWGITSDRDYTDQMSTVNSIKEEIATLDDSVDNLLVLGDANADGKVNVLDYQKVVNMILDPTLQPEEDNDLFVNLDINQNTVIEVGDLTAIVNYILTQEWADGYAAVKAFGQANESLTMDITQVQQGVQRYAINLQNVEDYTAFQLDVVLPEGMTIVGSSLSERAGESHKLWSRAQMDGSVRLLASSVKGDTFSGNEGAVLYIDVQTDANFKGGSVEMLNILFSDVNAQTRAFAIGNGGEATGIDIMAAMQSLKQKVYDLGGRVMNGMRKGVNIIQNADGTTKKVLK